MDVVKSSWAAAKMNSKFICVETCSGYRSSVLDPQGRQHLLPLQVSDGELGAAVLDALAHSRFVTPQEDLALFDYQLGNQRYAAWVTNLMSHYGYKTKRELFKTMSNCNITSSSGLIVISPTQHEALEGWSGDGIAEEDHIQLPADSSPSEVGAALKLAFSRCI